MKNVLIITAGYCGKATANGICAQALVREFENQRTTVYVISFDSESVTTTSEKIISIYNPPNENLKRSYNIVSKIGRFSKSVLFHTWTPKYNKNIVEQIVKEANRIFNEVEIDAVICIYFPIESIIAAHQLKKRYRHFELIVYELDSVADGIAGGLKGNKRILFSYKRYLSYLYKKADLILVQECHKIHWMKEHLRHQSKMRVVDLPLLCFSNLPNIEKNNTCTTFLYAGTLSPVYRSPNKLLQVFENISHQLSYELIFFSKGCDDILQNAVKNDNSIVYRGYVEQSVLENEIARSDVLLSIGNAISNSLPSKIIVYMTYCKPIIHFCLKENDVCEQYLNKYPLALVIKCDEKVEDAAKRIIEFMNSSCGKTVSFDSLCDTFPMNLPSYSVNLILDFISGKEGQNV
jgi:hypothetical protein